jgi:FkbM family methyltransferase
MSLQKRVKISESRTAHMIKEFYLACLRYPRLRRALRKARAEIQRISGYSDPFYDLADLSQRCDAALFLDIGCHHGDALLRFIESGVRCPIAAFDPFGDNIARAKKQLSQYPRVRFHQIALSNTNGSAVFYLNQNEQTSSLLPNDSGNQESFAADTTPLGSCEVTTMTLDAWAARSRVTGPCIIKCDTQGAEGLVIQGGKDFIREHCVAFYAEVMLGDMYKGQRSFGEIRALLEQDCGMVLQNVFPCLHDKAGQAVQMDALWVKREFLTPR